MNYKFVSNKYFLRTIEGFEEYTDMLQEVINDAFVPSLAGEDTPFTPTQNRLFSLPAVYQISKYFRLKFELQIGDYLL